MTDSPKQVLSAFPCRKQSQSKMLNCCPLLHPIIRPHHLLPLALCQVT